MNHQHHIEQLKKQIEHLQNEPAQNWIGKFAKSVKVRNIQKKISSLEKQMRKQNDKKTDTFL